MLRRKDQPDVTTVPWGRLALRAQLKSVVRGVAMRFGLELRKASPMTAAARRVKALRELGVETVVDVGASFGEYGRLLRHSGYTGRIISFEPLSAPFNELKRQASADSGWDSHQLALGETTAIAPIHIARNSVSSSLLTVTRDHASSAPDSIVVSSEQVSVVTLDRVASELLPDSGRIFMKLDVQGTELQALRGAEGTLPRIQGLEIELSLVELYKGQPLLPEVWSHVASRGFQCIGLEPVFADPETGHLLQVDALFVRPQRLT